MAAEIAPEYLRRLERQEHDCSIRIALSLARLMRVSVEDLFSLGADQEARLDALAAAILSTPEAEPSLVAPSTPEAEPSLVAPSTPAPQGSLVAPDTAA